MSDEEYPDFTFETATSVGSDIDWGHDDGFNEHGVRENDDGSIDVIYRAMEPGIRNGFEVTESFLEGVASKNRDHDIDVQFDHTDEAYKHVGWIESAPDTVWYRDSALGIQFHVPDTGNRLRSDVISDFTHDPPALRHGSVGFEPSSIEYELPDGYDSIGSWYWDYLHDDHDGNPELTDADLQEFSIVTHPGGYEKPSGGLSPAFQRSTPEGRRSAGQSRLSTKPRNRLTFTTRE